MCHLVMSEMCLVALVNLYELAASKKTIDTRAMQSKSLARVATSFFVQITSLRIS